MDLPQDRQKSALTALLFASAEPLSLKEIATQLDPESRTDEKTWIFHLKEIEKDIEDSKWGIELREHAGGYQLVTQPIYNSCIKALSTSVKNEKLSLAACEVLALLSVEEPMTRMQIEEARGVDSSAVIQSLIEKEIVEVKGRLKTPSSPALYGLGKGFFIHFNLKDREHLNHLYENSKESKLQP